MAADTWPKVGDPCLGYERAPDCPATDDPAGFRPMYVACTRDEGHAPPHVADGLDTIVHVWVSDADLRALAEANPEGAAALLAFLFAPDDPEPAERPAAPLRRKGDH
jgi:hypothetical protein